MPEYEDLDPGAILASASVADFISRMGLAVAEAQRELDENALNTAAALIESRDELGERTLLDMGFTPTFYAYQHADLSVSLQLSMRISEEEEFGLGFNASYGGDFENEDSSDSSQRTERSRSSEYTGTREGKIELDVVSSNENGKLTLGGKDYPVTGTDPLARIGPPIFAGRLFCGSPWSRSPALIPARSLGSRRASTGSSASKHPRRRLCSSSTRRPE